MLESHREHTASELAVSLGVDRSYVAKLRTGWRPTRVRDDLLGRLTALDPDARQSRAPGSAAFYDGVLFAAQAMSETVARLLAEARAGLRPASLTPTAGEVVVGMEALDAAGEADLPGHSPRKRKGQSRPA